MNYPMQNYDQEWGIDLDCLNYDRLLPIGFNLDFLKIKKSRLKGMDTIDQWLDIVGRGRANIAPEQIPWEAIGTLLSQAIYGGKMDNPFDQRLLDTFLAKLFKPATFEDSFILAKPEGNSPIQVPDGTKVSSYKDWIQQLPQLQKPSFMGLPDNAETVLLTAKGRDLIRKVLLGMTKEQESAKVRRKSRKIFSSFLEIIQYSSTGKLFSFLSLLISWQS